MDSEQIQNAFSLPVINTGVHAAFGLKYMLDVVTPFLESQDNVIIIPEYEHFLNSSDVAGIEFIDALSQFHTKLDKNQLRTCILYFWRYLLRWLFLTEDKAMDSVYYREAFNKYGDITSHLSKESLFSLGVVPRESVKRKLDTETIQYMKNWVKQCANNGIRVFFAYPCHPDKSVTAMEESIAELETVLHKNVSAVFISTPYDFAYPENYFFDTPYHLNATGREIRTQKIIECLSPYF